MRELWGEITASIMRNKLRTVLTGFSVAWGIFMLVVLLGAGRGFENGITGVMGERTQNVVQISGSYTSMPYKGYQKDRRILLDKSDIRFIKESFPDIATDVSGTFGVSATASVGNNFTPVYLDGVTPTYQGVRGVEIFKGRFPNDMDIAERRKVVAVEKDVADILFPRTDAIGKEIVINNVIFKVIGITKPRRYGGQLSAYAPISTMETVYAASFRNYNNIIFLANGLKTTEQNKEFTELITRKIKAKHSIAPEDPRGIWVWNRYQSFTEMSTVIKWVNLFILLIGISTLMAGIVGVSNIMMVTVRERMNEIGVRKAIGASPRQILMMIMSESVVITVFFGYIGLLLGMGLMEILSYSLENQGEESRMSMIFTNPTVDMRIAITATVILVIAGLIAGFIPALRAVRMKTIDTLRQQK